MLHSVLQKEVTRFLKLNSQEIGSIKLTEPLLIIDLENVYYLSQNPFFNFKFVLIQFSFFPSVEITGLKNFFL